jgi:hypothetical protein
MRRLLSIIVLLLCARELHATVLLPAEFREIVAGSQVIVYGRVTDVRAEWSDDRRRIDTIVPGGQIGRYRNVVIGAPSFAPGEEAVLFLSAPGPSVAHVFGLSQGVFRVRVDPRTGRRLVVPPVLTARGDAPETIVRGDRSRQQLSLDAFAATVRTAMDQPGGGR